MSYEKTITDWRKERDKNIRQENGWLSLAGLFWLKPGKNRIGSDPSSEIILPARFPSNMGHVEYNEKSVSLHVEPNAKVKVNDQVIESVILQPDISEAPSYINLQDVQLVVIQRGNRLGMRMWDNKREQRRSFPARTWYDIDKNFRVPATFTAYERPKMAIFADLAGEKAEFPVEGYLSFEFNGKQYKLDVNREDDNKLFIRFWDPTSEDETCPNGRYLVADSDADGRIFLDFNKAYNPPCAFTEYATCVFAPEQNHLDFRVTAGETYRRQK
ncbi:MAG: DUF1684 domain-containing protein [Anaerolineales bacterium]|nr:MAG: DUF1684 domain-containing protein [Anaerolineales bacterium]